jgi:signal transduction histidine kinase
MMVAVLAIGISAIWSILGWSGATAKLSGIYNRSMLAERLRGNAYRQAEYGEDFLEGQADAERKFMEIQSVTQSLLSNLRANIQSSEEADHIEGLQETQYEMVWIMNGFFKKSHVDSMGFDRQRAHERLLEIADEVTDDVLALNQYYRSRENENIMAAAKAGKVATIVIGFAAAIAFLQLLAMIFLLRAWFVKPITVMGAATKEISSGNLDVQIATGQGGEWGQLASAIGRMAKSLKISQQRLVAQERLAALGEIAAYTAHNLRNPLAGIRAAAQVSLAESKDLDSDITESFNDIIESVDRLDIWIKRFLEYARPLNLTPEETDLNDLLTQAVLMAQRPYSEDNISLCFSLADNLPHVLVDPALLEQAILALVSNAFDATPSGGSIKIETSCAPGINGNEWVIVNIADSGNGIVPQVRSRLFQPFVTSKDKGTGLGLAQAKKIIDLHGGEIGLNDAEEKGTMAIIRLPLHR